MAWRDREIAAGRDDSVPPEGWELEGPAVSISLGDATDIDPVLLAAICGPDGLGGDSPGPQFGQDRAADVLRPGPVLAALAEQAAEDPGRLSDDELIGVLRASRRLQARESYRQAMLTAELARRREAVFTAAARRGVPSGCRPGAFPGEELAGELLISRGEASRRIDTATDLAARMPATRASMAAGLIDYAHAEVIAFYTRGMDPADAARSEAALAAAAPALRLDQLARRAAALEMKLAPDAAKARKEHAKSTARRVEVRRELSGNASLAAREMDTANAMASYAYISAVAARLRKAGLAGPIGALRSIAMSDLTQGLDPLDRITPPPAPASASDPRPAGDPARVRTRHSRTHGGEPSGGEPSRGGPGGGGPGGGEPARPAPAPAPAPALTPAPVPAVVNITVPAGTLLGWSTTPGQAGGWGLLDHEEARAIVTAATRHPDTRFCFTLLGADGTAIAHGCARGQPPPQLMAYIAGIANHENTPGSPGSGSGPGPGPGARQEAVLTALFTSMNVTLRPISRATCGHGSAEDRYTPSRALSHLIRARNATCTAPGCGNQAVYCDLDHTTPYPHGPTCQCNLGSLCRTHHRAKQAPDWKIEQKTPGVFRWTMPSGRAHTTTPTTYET